jgi:hypothetical protein
MRPHGIQKPRLTELSRPSGKFLLILAKTVTLGSEFCGTHCHILLSHYSESAGEGQQQFTRPGCSAAW